MVWLALSTSVTGLGLNVGKACLLEALHDPVSVENRGVHGRNVGLQPRESTFGSSSRLHDYAFFPHRPRASCCQ
jgi:hypothetical protein